MNNTCFKNFHYKKIFLLFIWLVIGLIIINSVIVSSVNAQIPWTIPFLPLFGINYYGIPFPYMMPLFPPPIRQPAFGSGWALSGWSRGDFQLAIPAPRPVLRHAATTVSILITNEPTSAILIINPTLLYGQYVPVIVPTAPTLPALFSGKPLIFGSTPITSSNLQIFNYIANTFLLPSGIFFYILP